MIKLKQFESNQAAFDFVAEAILTQGKKSEIDGYCAYSTPGGFRCAIGQMVEPSEAEELERLCAGSNVIRLLGFNDNTMTRAGHPVLLDLNGLDTEFVWDLQKAHDNAGNNWFQVDFSTRMLDVAKKYNLDPSAIPALRAAIE